MKTTYSEKQIRKMKNLTEYELHMLKVKKALGHSLDSAFKSVSEGLIFSYDGNGLKRLGRIYSQKEIQKAWNKL